MVGTLAVMQPYFFPYLGYYALFARADAVVLLDCVQFARRGRVHRCEVPGTAPQETGAGNWLTLPLARQPVATAIRDLRFAGDAAAVWQARLARQTWYHAPDTALNAQLRRILEIRPAWNGTATCCDFLCTQIAFVCDLLGIPCVLSRSSALNIDPGLRGQDRIISIAKTMEAERYINLPGGKSLYDQDRFAKSGISLEFLPPYEGPYRFLLPSLFQGQAPNMAADLMQYSALPLEGAA